VVGGCGQTTTTTTTSGFGHGKKMREDERRASSPGGRYCENSRQITLAVRAQRPAWSDEPSTACRPSVPLGVRAHPCAPSLEEGRFSLRGMLLLAGSSVFFLSACLKHPRPVFKREEKTTPQHAARKLAAALLHAFQAVGCGVPAGRWLPRRPWAVEAWPRGVVTRRARRKQQRRREQPTANSAASSRQRKSSRLAAWGAGASVHHSTESSISIHLGPVQHKRFGQGAHPPDRSRLRMPAARGQEASDSQRRPPPPSSSQQASVVGARGLARRRLIRRIRGRAILKSMSLSASALRCAMNISARAHWLRAFSRLLPIGTPAGASPLW
jgi:hypothetical protein